MKAEPWPAILADHPLVYRPIAPRPRMPPDVPTHPIIDRAARIGPFSHQARFGLPERLSRFGGLDVGEKQRSPVRNSCGMIGCGKAAAAVLLRQKSVLNLRVDFEQPLFGAVGFVSIKLNFSI